jgi:hypothetical protein
VDGPRARARRHDALQRNRNRVEHYSESYVVRRYCRLNCILARLISFLLEDTDGFRHAIGVALHYVVPPGYTNLYTIAVRAGAVLDYSAQYKVLFENLGYAAIFFVAGCLIFTKREIRLG